jgi:hypothetical protein
MPIRNVGSDTPTSESRHDDDGFETARPQRRVDAEHDAEAQRDNRRGEGQFDGRRQALEDELRHRLLQPVGNAELAPERVRDKAEELHVEGIVESEPLSQRLVVGHRRFLPEHRGDRIADEAENQECDKATASMTRIDWPRRLAMKASMIRSPAACQTAARGSNPLRGGNLSVRTLSRRRRRSSAAGSRGEPAA